MSDSNLEFVVKVFIATELVTGIKDDSDPGTVDILEAAIPFLRDALRLCPPQYPVSQILNNLASALGGRYKALGDLEDLEESILFHRRALTHRPAGDPKRSASLGNLGRALEARYRELDDIRDLEECIAFQREELSLRSPDDPNCPILLENLGNTLKIRYNQMGNVDDLEDSISFHRRALSLRPPIHPRRAVSLCDLANALRTRHENFGDLEDLEESILLHRATLTYRPPGHPDRSSSLIDLAITLWTRYEKSGNEQDLEESISIYRSSLSDCSPDELSWCLGNLAIALSSRHGLLGNIEDLEDSILYHRDALNLDRPAGQPSHSQFNNLAQALMTRYNQLGNVEDLEESLTFFRSGVDLCPSGHTGRLIPLINLANALMARYDHSGDVKDLDDSILYQNDALSLVPPGHTARPVSLGNLANALTTRYRKFGNVKDLDKSISFQLDALECCPSSHPYRPLLLNNLGTALLSRHGELRNAKDLEDGISYYREADTLHPPGHVGKANTLHNIAVGLMCRFRDQGKEEDFEESIYLLEQAASDITSQLRDRLMAGMRLVMFAPACADDSVLFSAYKTQLQLVQRSLVFRPNVESQQRFLASANIPKSLASDAAAAAIEAGKLELAVEFLEQGRAILWSRVDGYKYPLQQLREIEGGGRLADRLEALGAELERLVLLSDPGKLNQKDSAQTVSFDTQMKQHRKLSEEWEELVQKIQQIEGFRHFLQAPPFDTLRLAAAEGPVILVNASEARSDAIILRKDSTPILVPLPEVQLEELDGQSLGSARQITRTLCYLWDNIVSPIVDCLAEIGIPRKSRIWWCPTGALCALPLHAAGRGKKNLHAVYTSSYTSTLSSLIRARSKPPLSSVKTPSLLVVGHPSDTFKLERVEVEVNTIKQLGHEGSVDVLFGSEASSQAVVVGLKSHSWVHFACHGHLGENGQPFQASFELHDCRLPVLDLLQARLPNAELAFLAACHSAEGGSSTPDESIHLSAALQFCGFRSVVGTLWEMDDEDGPRISQLFYDYMFRDPDKIDFKDSAHALNRAIQKMKTDGVPQDRLALFVHIGA